MTPLFVIAMINMVSFCHGDRLLSHGTEALFHDIYEKESQRSIQVLNDLETFRPSRLSHFSGQRERVTPDADRKASNGPVLLCPHGFVEYQSSCFYVSKNSSKSSRAAKQCFFFGGGLASVSTDENSQALHQFLESVLPSRNNAYWVGERSAERPFMCDIIKPNGLVKSVRCGGKKKRFICQTPKVTDGNIVVESPHPYDHSYDLNRVVSFAEHKCYNITFGSDFHTKHKDVLKIVALDLKDVGKIDWKASPVSWQMRGQTYPSHIVARADVLKLKMRTKVGGSWGFRITVKQCEEDVQDDELPTKEVTDSMSIFSTGVMFDASAWSSHRAVTLLSTDHLSYVYFSETMTYPFYFEFDYDGAAHGMTEPLNTDHVLSDTHVCWGWEQHNVDQFFTCLQFHPSGKVDLVVSTEEFLGASSFNTEQLAISAPISNFQVNNLTTLRDDIDPAVADWTAAMMAQNSTHISFALFADYVDTTISYASVNIDAYDANGQLYDTLIDSRSFLAPAQYVYSHFWYNGNGNNSLIAEVLGLTIVGTEHGLECCVPKGYFPPEVTTLSVRLLANGPLGSQGGAWKDSRVSIASFDLMDVYDASQPTPAQYWEADGNPADFKIFHEKYTTEKAPRRFGVLAERNTSTVYVNGEKCGAVNAPRFSDPMTPYGVMGLRNMRAMGGEHPTLFSDFKFFGEIVNKSDEGERVLEKRQCALNGSDRPFTLLYMSDSFNFAEVDIEMGMCPLYEEIEGQYGGEEFPVDPFTVVMEDFHGGLNAYERGSFIAYHSIVVSYVNYHELSHYAQCLGGMCNYNAHQWMYEGFASYYGQVAVNRVMGWPIHLYQPTVTMPTDFIANGDDDLPLEEGSAHSYAKGEVFLFLLSEVTSFEVVLQAVKGNYGRWVTPKGFISDIEAICGYNISEWTAGWLYSGDYYRNITPAMSYDSDGDGLADFQEVFRGYDPTSCDSDGDGYSDGWEVAHDFDALNASDPGPGSVQEWAVDGVPEDFPFADSISSSFSWEASGAHNLTTDAKCKRISNSSTLACSVWYDTSVAIDRKKYYKSYFYVRDAVNAFAYATYFFTRIGNKIGALPSYFDKTREPLPQSLFTVVETNQGMEFTIPAPTDGEDTSVSFVKGSFSDKFETIDLFIPWE